MSRVRALHDITTPNGLIVARAGNEGIALHKRKATPANYNKVAVRWTGRTKVYWCSPDDIKFDEKVPMDPRAYVAMPPGKAINFPKLPTPPDVFDYNFGTNLRQFRKDRGISQRELSTQLSTSQNPASQTTVSYWERNAEAPRGRYVQALSKALNVPAYLFFINFNDCLWLDEAEAYLKQLRELLCGGATA